jgi:hypothetical protein
MCKRTTTYSFWKEITVEVFKQMIHEFGRGLILDWQEKNDVLYVSCPHSTKYYFKRIPHGKITGKYIYFARKDMFDAIPE